MNIFNPKTPTDRRLDCVQRMLFNVVMNLKDFTDKLDEAYLQLFYRLLSYRVNTLTPILNAIEAHGKVIVFFEMKRGEGKHSLEFAVRTCDDKKVRWENLFDGLNGNADGLCINFCFDNDNESSPWYFFDEKDLRGRALAKVFDIK